MSCSFIEHFLPLKDSPHRTQATKYVIDILILTVCATLSVTEGWKEIEKFDRRKLYWLRHFDPLNYGAPSHDLHCLRYFTTLTGRIGIVL